MSIIMSKYLPRVRTHVVWVAGCRCLAFQYFPGWSFASLYLPMLPRLLESNWDTKLFTSMRIFWWLALNNLNNTHRLSTVFGRWVWHLWIFYCCAWQGVWRRVDALLSPSVETRSTPEKQNWPKSRCSFSFLS